MVLEPKVEVLLEIWTELEQFRRDIASFYSTDLKDVAAVQIRGYNPKSVNSPKKQGEMTLWVNRTDSAGPMENNILLERHKVLLIKVWNRILNEISDNVDRVLIATEDCTFYVPGIYPAHIDINVYLPIYQHASLHD